MVGLNLNLPESFFHEENREGYTVSTKIKKLWAVQLDLLNEFDKVCKMHGLKYFLFYGSLLGAIRHGGYIPWDDDLDLVMLREDYDKLVEIGAKEFKEPYFLQTYLSENNYDVPIAKLRRSDTAFYEKLDHHATYNQGIFIDIFVFDSIPSKESFSELACKSYKMFHPAFVLSHVPSCHDGWRLPFASIRYWIYRLIYGSYKKAYARFDAFAKSFPKSEIVSNLTYIWKPRYFLREWFEETTLVKFENMTVPVPANYEEVLTTLYGDYKVPVKGGSSHETLLFDADNSYKTLS